MWRVMDRAMPERGWFWRAFTETAEAVVARWAPPWARARVLGRPIGVWVLQLAWVALPVAVAFGW
jgi:hypothetical protein